MGYTIIQHSCHYYIIHLILVLDYPVRDQISLVPLMDGRVNMAVDCLLAVFTQTVVLIAIGAEV